MLLHTDVIVLRYRNPFLTVKSAGTSGRRSRWLGTVDWGSVGMHPANLDEMHERIAALGELAMG